MDKFEILCEKIMSKYLYHATYQKLLNSIKKKGLIPNNKNKNYSDSKDFVYLANDPWVAESYAETSEEVPEDWLDEIVILKVAIKDLDPNLLSKDKNVQDGNSTFEYNGIIPWNKLKIV